jgi:transposase
MRGRVSPQRGVWMLVIDPEDLLGPKHPLRSVKMRADEVLAAMDKEFAAAYASAGRPSIPPEMLLKALLLQALYSIRSEEQLMEQVGVNLMYRWFLDLSPEQEEWDPTAFTRMRERFVAQGLVRSFFDRIVEGAYVEGLASEEHFSIDGTLIQSYASMKSLRRIESADQKVSDGSDDGDPGNPTVNFRGEKRGNTTHRSLSDPEARLARKRGQSSILAHSVHALMENRHGLLVDVSVAEANGTAERVEALGMLAHARERHRLSPKSVGGDRGYAAGEFLCAIEEQGTLPHVPISADPIRGSDAGAQARRRARERMQSDGYMSSQRVRKRIEEIFGWAKEIGGLRRSRHVGRPKIGQNALIIGAAYNLLRLARLAPCYAGAA